MDSVFDQAAIQDKSVSALLGIKKQENEEGGFLLIIIIKSGFCLPCAPILSMNRNPQALEKNKKKKKISKNTKNLQCIIFQNSKTWLIIGMEKNEMP